MKRNIFGILVLVLSTLNAVAVTFTVMNTNDSGAGSLRQAIADSNTTAGSDTITFDPIVFSTPQTIVLAGTVLTINPATGDTLTITGPGASLLTVSGNNAVRVFAISSGDTVNISGLTVTQGNGTTGASPGFGGGIYNQGILTVTNLVVTGNSATIDGGGIYNSTSDTLNVINCTISNNIGDSDNAGTGNGGGGLYCTGSGIMNVTNSTINGNSVGNSASGGGIHNVGTTTITNSTISGNSSGVDGGGVYLGNAGAVSLTNSTVVSNTAAGAGGGAYRGVSGTFNVRNTIIANNTDNGTAPDFNGLVTSQGYNLIETTTGTTFVGDTTGNISGVDPNVGALQNNGGGTLTHALLAGSPAVDKGESSGATTDQRGALRPFDNAAIPNAAGGDAADIGAFEVQLPVVVGALSRKTHTGAGPFDISLLTMPPGTESRSGGAGGNYQVIVTFASPATVGGISVMSSNGLASGMQSVSGAVVTVDLAAVANAQTVGITLINVTEGANSGDVFIPLGVLIGDSNGDAVVNSGDAVQTRSRSGQTTNGTNYRSDFNVEGTINSGDVLVARSRSGTSLP